MAFFTSTNGHAFQIDDNYINLVAERNWHYSLSSGVQATVNGKTVRLHRLLMGSPKNKEIDHINGDTSDNRLRNLRVCRHSQNAKNRKLNINNTSGFKGVHRHNNNKWLARISMNGKKISLGIFSSPDMAAIAYQKAAKKLHGEFSRRLEGG